MAKEITVFVTTKASYVHSPATLPRFAKSADKVILQHSAQTRHLSSDMDNEWPSTHSLYISPHLYIFRFSKLFCVTTLIQGWFNILLMVLTYEDGSHLSVA